MALVVRLSGGLGNQMFQFAAGYSHAKSTGTDLMIDVSLVLKDQLREFELERVFHIMNEVITTEKILNMEARHRWIKNLIGDSIYNRLIPYYRRAIIYERKFNYDENFNKFNSGSILVGYYQSEKYFNKHSREIRSIFSFENRIKELDDVNRFLLETILSNKLSVSIHVRREDYLKSNLHFLQQPEYYDRAIEFIGKKYENEAQYFVFSDEQKWVQNNLNLPENAIYVSGNGGTKSYIDMLLMSKCRINIIANSSFSWWAAWLNNYEDKMVIAPENWFTDKNMNTDDLIPASWIKL